MTRTAARKHRHKPVGRQTTEKRALDNGVYATIILVSGFILLIWFLLDPQRQSFNHAVVGCVAAILGWINYVAIKAWRGGKLPDWQRSLARLPLQFAGYGREGGKPVEAAKGQPNARNAVAVFLAASVLVVVVLAVLLMR